MDSLTDLLQDFIKIFTQASFKLMPIAVGLLYWTTAFQIIRACMRNITEFPFFSFFKSLVFYFVYRYVIENWNQIIFMLKDTVVRIGEKGAGVGYNTFQFDPDYIFDKIFSILNPLSEKFEILSGGTYGYGIAWLIGILLGLFLALNLFIFYLEFLAITSLSIIFIPFLAFEKTDFLGTKVFSAVTSQLIRLMFYSFLMSICLVQFNSGVNKLESVQQGFQLILTIAGLSWLTWKVPELIGALLNGTPSMNWNSAWNSSKTGFESTKSLGRGGAKTAKIAGKTVAGGYTLGRDAYNGAKTKIGQMARFKKPRQ